MEGGVISGNVSKTMGGGVHVYDGVFTMKGGTIRDNYAGLGGGVCIWGGGSFIMEGGTIRNNHALNGTALGVPVSGGGQGGGVFVSNNSDATDKGAFTMKGGTIYGTSDVLETNTAQNGGASLFVNNGATARYGNGTTITSSSSNATLTGIQ
jgi:hypothetical protein